MPGQWVRYIDQVLARQRKRRSVICFDTKLNKVATIGSSTWSDLRVRVTALGHLKKTAPPRHPPPLVGWSRFIDCLYRDSACWEERNIKCRIISSTFSVPGIQVFSLCQDLTCLESIIIFPNFLLFLSRAVLLETKSWEVLYSLSLSVRSKYDLSQPQGEAQPQCSKWDMPQVTSAGAFSSNVVPTKPIRNFHLWSHCMTCIYYQFSTVSAVSKGQGEGT